MGSVVPHDSVATADAAQGTEEGCVAQSTLGAHAWYPCSDTPMTQTHKQTPTAGVMSWAKHNGLFCH